MYSILAGDCRPFASAYTVHETKQAIITRSANPWAIQLPSPLHFRTFVQTVHMIEKRFLEWEAADRDADQGQDLY